MNDTSPFEAPEPIKLHVTINLNEAMAVGIRRLRKGRLEGAEAVYQAVLAVAPECVDALHFLDVLRYQRGQHEAAMDLDTAISLITGWG